MIAPGTAVTVIRAGCWLTGQRAVARGYQHYATSDELVEVVEVEMSDGHRRLLLAEWVEPDPPAPA